MTQLDSFFVYGTLQRGQCRETCWPCVPLMVTKASVQGRLYDLVKYPALIDGEDRVLGEVWKFAPRDIEQTKRVLDEIEGYNQGGNDLYLRKEVECELNDGQRQSAFCYFFANPDQLKPHQLLSANDDGIVQWPMA